MPSTSLSSFGSLSLPTHQHPSLSAMYHLHHYPHISSHCNHSYSTTLPLSSFALSLISAHLSALMHQRPSLPLPHMSAYCHLSSMSSFGSPSLPTHPVCYRLSSPSFPPYQRLSQAVCATPTICLLNNLIVTIRPAIS